MQSCQGCWGQGRDERVGYTVRTPSAFRNYLPASGAAERVEIHRELGVQTVRDAKVELLWEYGDIPPKVRVARDEFESSSVRRV